MGDVALVAQYWPLLIATFVSSMAVPAMNLFIAPIAMELGTSAAFVGGLRALSGISALVIGVGLAPLVDRVPRAGAITAGLLFTAIAIALVTVGNVAALIAFNIMLGVTTAVLLPALQAASADRTDGPTSARALAMVVSMPPLASLLAGPLLVPPALIAGWQGAFAAIAVACCLTAAAVAPVLSWQRPANVTRAGYRQAFGIVASAPGALASLSLSVLQSCVWFGWLTYLAAFFTEQFEGSTGLVALVWFLGGGTFFGATVIVGRITSSSARHEGSEEAVALTILKLAVAVNPVLAPLVFLAPSAPIGLLLTMAFCVTSGATQSALSSLLIRRYSSIRGAVMALNAAGRNVGMIAGAILAGLGLGFSGYPGLATVLFMLGIPAIGALLHLLRPTPKEREL